MKFMKNYEIRRKQKQGADNVQMQWWKAFLKFI